jgi:hypothetical protein
MLSIRAANDRAIRRAIRTGELANADLIHRTQRSEGFSPCFGRSEQKCTRTDCRWLAQCMALQAFDETPNGRAALTTR